MNPFLTHFTVTEHFAPIECRKLGVHAVSVPQLRLPARLMKAGCRIAALSVLALSVVRLGQFVNVVHHAVQAPLC